MLLVLIAGACKLPASQTHTRWIFETNLAVIVSSGCSLFRFVPGADRSRQRRFPDQSGGRSYPDHRAAGRTCYIMEQDRSHGDSLIRSTLLPGRLTVPRWSETSAGTGPQGRRCRVEISRSLLDGHLSSKLLVYLATSFKNSSRTCALG